MMRGSFTSGLRGLKRLLSDNSWWSLIRGSIIWIFGPILDAERITLVSQFFLLYEKLFDICQLHHKKTITEVLLCFSGSEDEQLEEEKDLITKEIERIAQLPNTSS